jgi:nitrogen fixation protein NifX
LRVAFATADREHVNEQFRRASHLVVYEVSPTGWRHERTCVFPPERALRTDERIGAIAGAAIVFVTAIGPSSAARLAQRGIRAATAPEGTRISDLLVRLGAAGAGLLRSGERVSSGELPAD